MKRKLLLFCTAIFLICFFSGCVVLPGNNTSDSDESKIPGGSSVTTEPDGAEPNDISLETLQKEISQSSIAVGVAFIGYVNSESSEADLRAYLGGSETGKKYPFLSSAPLVITEGQELYAIVPANKKATITVYPSSMTEDGEYSDDKSVPLYTGKTGETILLRCNLSEIYSNVLITVTDGGTAMDFRPALSMEDGRLPEITGVYDFSVYSTYTDAPEEYSVEIAMAILCDTDEIKAAMKRGMKVLYTGETQVIEGRTCLLFALGTDHDEQFVRECYYGVCGNLIYAYDAVNDTWTPHGME